MPAPCLQQESQWLVVCRCSSCSSSLACAPSLDLRAGPALRTCSTGRRARARQTDCKCLVHTGCSISTAVKNSVIAVLRTLLSSILHCSPVTCKLAEKPSPVFVLCLLRASAIERLTIRRGADRSLTAGRVQGGRSAENDY